MFYQNPRDLLQELAAQQLADRDWRWHKVLRQWMQKDTRDANNSSSLPLVDMTNGAPIGTPSIRKSAQIEHGVYIFFDAMNWRRERRFLDLDLEHLEAPRMTTLPTGPVAGLGGPPGRLATDMAQHAGVGSSQIPSA